MSFPTHALSLRQPWAHFMLKLPPEHLKRIENRMWGPSSFRGPFWFHASVGMTKREFYDACEFAEDAGVPKTVLPSFAEVERGGIVGRGSIVGHISPSGSDIVIDRPAGGVRFDDRWHIPGQWGYLVVDAVPIPMVPCKGMLGFWKVPEPVLAELRRVAA